MKCTQIKDKFPDYLTGELDEDAKKAVQIHLSTCSSCREELANLSETWTRLEVLPEEQPSPAVRSRFYAMLEDYKKGMEKKEFRSPLARIFGGFSTHWWPRRPAFQALLALILIMAGMAAGFLLNSGGQSPAEISRLQAEIHSIRQTLAVSLLEQSSPSDRLRGVSLSYHMERPSKKTLKALLNTLNNDPNVNVRLAAVDALYLFYNHPQVKEGLIHSLSNQTSPLVQVALIDLIINMRERRAIEAFKKLIQDEKLNPDVKQRAEQGIQQLSY